MRHRILTCKNHPELRWSCKDIAWSGFYNSSRKIFYFGRPDGKGMYFDGSGLSCTKLSEDKKSIVEECECPSSDLILAPEDKLVTI